MSGRRVAGVAVAVAAAAAVAWAPRAGAQGGAAGAPRPTPGGIAARASATPAATELGARVRVTWTLSPASPAAVRFVPPEDAGAFHWSGFESRLEPRRGTMGRGPARPTRAGRDVDAVAEADLQVFALGDVEVPGPEVEVDTGAGPVTHRMPTLKLTVVPVVAAADTAPQLRPARGPLPAPWWERVPWRWVAAAALLAAVVVALVRWARARRRRPRPVPATAPPRPVRDPVAEALADLAALRRLDLPAQGRFDEHAFRLTRIARRFLEAVAGATRPGDTTPEVVEHLAGAPLAAGEVARVEGLLRTWDRVKFARAPYTAEEAHRTEAAVEDLVRRHAPPGTAGGAGRAA